MGYLMKVVGVLLVFGCSTLGSEAEPTPDGHAKIKVTGEGLINLGNRGNTWAPLMHTTVKISEVNRIKSSFEFRTFDPEGVVFYGDNNDGADWFLMCLRGGVPEMQIGMGGVLTSVKGGPKLNNGYWHKVVLRSQGKFVVLEVDDVEALVVGLSSKDEDSLTGNMRLALGGILMDKSRLILPFRPAMEACVRNGKWLNLSTHWETDRDWQEKVCPAYISKGSFFPGSGLLVFNTTDLPVAGSDENGITLRLGFYVMDQHKINGTIVTLQSPDFTPLLTMSFNNDTKILQVGKVFLPVDMDYASIKLTLGKISLKIEVDEYTLEVDDPHNYPAAWRQGLILSFGGLPGNSEDYSGTDYLQGCLKDIQIQGKDVDQSLALYKHKSVSSHFCPGEKFQAAETLLAVIGSFPGRG